MEKKESYLISSLQQLHVGEKARNRDAKAIAQNHTAQLGHKPAGIPSPHALPLHNAAPQAVCQEVESTGTLAHGRGLCLSPPPCPSMPGLLAWTGGTCHEGRCRQVLHN